MTLMTLPLFSSFSEDTGLRCSSGGICAAMERRRDIMFCAALRCTAELRAADDSSEEEAETDTDDGVRREDERRLAGLDGCSTLSEAEGEGDEDVKGLAFKVEQSRSAKLDVD